MSFNKYPSVHFKLNKEIDTSNIPNREFEIERRYHSGGTLITDKILCKVMGIAKFKINPLKAPTVSNEQKKIPANQSNKLKH